MVRSRFNNFGEDRPSGIYNMGGTDYPYRPNTGNGFASFLLGSVSSAGFTQNRATWLPRWWTHGFYLQDDYKPTRHLTLNFGIRWGYESPFQTKYGQQSQFDPHRHGRAHRQTRRHRPSQRHARQAGPQQLPAARSGWPGRSTRTWYSAGVSA